MKLNVVFVFLDSKIEGQIYSSGTLYMGKLDRRENKNIGKGSFRQRDYECIVLVQCGKIY
jgi:hypothetical protein